MDDSKDDIITPRTRDDEEKKRAKKKKSKDDGEKKKKRKEKVKQTARRRFCPAGVTDEEATSAKRRCESRRQELETVMQERKRREMQKLLGGSLAPAQSDFALKTSSLAQSSYIVNTLNPEARTLTAKYTNMLTQERLADVVFEMPGGEKAYAHIAVLLVRCPKLAEFVMSKKKKKNLKRQVRVFFFFFFFFGQKQCNKTKLTKQIKKKPKIIPLTLFTHPKIDYDCLSSCHRRACSPPFLKTSSFPLWRRIWNLRPLPLPLHFILPPCPPV